MQSEKDTWIYVVARWRIAQRALLVQMLEDDAEGQMDGRFQTSIIDCIALHYVKNESNGTRDKI